MPPPLIGVTRDSDGRPDVADPHFVHYATSVEKAGGRARPIYYRENLAAIDGILDQFDGLIFSGGDDLDPALYGQPWHPGAKPVDPRRQCFELALLAAAEARHLPLLGICLGAQLMNVARGGSLIQFLPDYPRANPLEHRKLDEPSRWHSVTLAPGSILHATVGQSSLRVNSSHKQALDRPGRGLIVSARASDGIAEAIEDPALPLFLGVQWHPERLHDRPKHLALFQLLTKASA